MAALTNMCMNQFNLIVYFILNMTDFMNQDVHKRRKHGNRHYVGQSFVSMFGCILNNNELCWPYSLFSFIINTHPSQFSI